MDTPFILEQAYDAPIDAVWQALANKDPMKVWYFPQLISFEPVEGFDMSFDDDGSAYKKQWQVTQVVPGKKLAHNWRYQGYEGASEVIFELFEEGGRTRLRLTHTDLASFPNGPHFARNRFEDGWK